MHVFIFKLSFRLLGNTAVAAHWAAICFLNIIRQICHCMGVT